MKKEQRAKWRDRLLGRNGSSHGISRQDSRCGGGFYLFCGFMLKPDSYDKFYRDIGELFQRIRILMQYGCVGYVMRHEDYHKAPIENLYVQVARWCNQQQFYKKMSFWEDEYNKIKDYDEKIKRLRGTEFDYE